jgi:hypothetical protein
VQFVQGKKNKNVTPNEIARSGLFEFLFSFAIYLE